MARYDHLPIFKSAYDLVLAVYQVTRSYGREYKYTLGEKIKDTAQEILDLVIETNSLSNEHKPDNLRRLLLKTEKLRMSLRISCDLKILSPKFLGRLAERIEEIERQAAGWIKYSLAECGRISVPESSPAKGGGE